MEFCQSEQNAKDTDSYKRNEKIMKANFMGSDIDNKHGLRKESTNYK